VRLVLKWIEPLAKPEAPRAAGHRLPGSEIVEVDDAARLSLPGLRLDRFLHRLSTQQLPHQPTGRR
jgi:hypothetical protein